MSSTQNFSLDRILPFVYFPSSYTFLCHIYFQGHFTPKLNLFIQTLIFFKIF
ncbi:hypothetical protein GYH30_022975 [Glycine max]|uniref:Uncharacterized protein n=1 Tax=Glycine max TaxID=3847 RepID=K7LA06_SOYBN|nr:hypothetical protein GYH30_022975 [Glycine max]